MLHVVRARSSKDRVMAMKRELYATRAELENRLGVDTGISGIVRAAVREQVESAIKLRKYQQRKYGCDELDRSWRFTYNHKAERLRGEPFCIYGIADPRDHVIRYVGWTKQSLRARLSKHISAPVGQYMARWLGGLVDAGIMPEIVPLQWCFDYEAAERFWIARMRAIGTLLNVTDGGRGNRRRCIGSRLKTIGGPVKVFSKEEVAALNAENLARARP